MITYKITNNASELQTNKVVLYQYYDQSDVIRQQLKLKIRKFLFKISLKNKIINFSQFRDSGLSISCLLISIHFHQ